MPRLFTEKYGAPQPLKLYTSADWAGDQPGWAGLGALGEVKLQLRCPSSLAALAEGSALMYSSEEVVERSEEEGTSRSFRPGGVQSKHRMVGGAAVKTSAIESRAGLPGVLEGVPRGVRLAGGTSSRGSY